MEYIIFNKTKSRTISTKARIANNFFLRLIGLMFKSSLDREKALIFYNAPSIHTFFMRFPIDIVFLNRKMEVIRICKSLKPWAAVFCRKAFVTIEFPPNHVSVNNLELEDILELKHSKS